MSALLLTGGRGHPPEASVGSIRAVLAAFDLDVEVHTDVDAGLQSLDEDHRLLVVNALQFAMTDPRYDEVRDREGFILGSDAAAAIREWHESDRPILALHTAVISFDTWAPWAKILGARWDWTRSSHPPIGPTTLFTGHDPVEHTVTAGLEIIDEAYRDLDLADGSDVVAWSVVDGIRQPAAWTRTPIGGGRVAVDLLGHDARSLTHPDHVALLHALLRWLLECEATVQISRAPDPPRPDAPGTDGLR